MELEQLRTKWDLSMNLQLKRNAFFGYILCRSTLVVSTNTVRRVKCDLLNSCVPLYFGDTFLFVTYVILETAS